jgi:UrcA family protein
MNKLLFASALSRLAASPTLAATAPRTQSVSYRDLDLARPEGRATLDRRIENAIRDVCETSAHYASLREFVETRRCLRLTRAAASQGARLAELRARRAAGQLDLATR